MLLKCVGFAQLQKKAGTIVKKMNDRKVINARAVTVVDAWIQKNFQQEGRLAVEGGWKPLSARTLLERRKGKKSHGHKILQDTGTLKGRWKHRWTSRYAKIQSMVDYAMKHHLGKGHIPKRPILPTNEQIWPKLERLYKDWIRKIIT